MSPTRVDATHLPQLVSASYALLMLSVGVLVALLEPGLVRFAPLSVAELTAILTPLIIVSLFMERALEVFVTAWRQTERDQLDLACESPEIDGAERDLRRRLATAHRGQTRCVALLASVTLGVLVSALGLRALEHLVDADMLAALAHWQRVAFTLLDVTITGALLAGGSEGLHKVIATFTTFMEQSSRRMRSPVS